MISRNARLFLIAAAVAAAAVIAVLPNVIWRKPGPPPPAFFCWNQLRAIYHAKAVWALEQRKNLDDVPKDADLFGLGRELAEKPTCPAGGTYIIGKVGEKPRCTFHSLE